MNERIDESQLRKALSALKPDDQLFEIRVLMKPKRTLSGYFRDIDRAIECLDNQNLRDANVFFTLNTIKDDCYDRIQHDCLRIPENTTADEEIMYYDWLLVDLDPVRATGVSSTDAELEAAHTLAKTVYAFLKNEGFEEPVIAMSGNGYHLLYRIGLISNDENKAIVENVLKALDLLFSTDEVKIDIANFNPSRICKMYGTLAQKGAGTEQRPHRMSYIVSIPGEIKKTKRAYLQKIADQLPKEEKPQAYNNYMPRQFDIREWMARNGIRYKERSGSEYTKFVLEECPFNSSHRAPDSMITIGTSGAIGFKCLHNSCQGKTWRDVRIKYEPDAYDRPTADDQRIEDGWQQHKLHNRDKDIDYSEPTAADPDKPMWLTAKTILAEPVETEDFILSGIEGIDNRLRGLKKGYVSILSGLRGNSKSTLLTTIILNAVNDGNNVLCYSGELTPKNFMRWMYLQAAGKGHVRKTEKWDNYYYVERDTQQAIADWMGDRFMLYQNDYGNSFKNLYANLKKQVEVQKTDLIILDNLMALDIRDLDPADKYSAQKEFIVWLQRLAKHTLTHIIFVAHPRKTMGFLRLEDIAGTADLLNLTDNAFIVHRNNQDFRQRSKEMFKWDDSNIAYRGTNVIEIAKDRDGGTQDVFIPLWYEPETKRLKNSEAEVIRYGWDKDGFVDVDDMEIPF